MKTRIIIWISLMLLGSVSTTVAQPHRLARDVRSLVRHGNKLYHKGQRADASAQYTKAHRADSTSALVTYNLATSLFPDEWKLISDSLRSTVAALFKQSGETEENLLRRSQSYHNMGVAFQTGGDFSNAIEAYKQALRCNPHDDEARYNLVLCQRQLKDQPQDDSQGQGDDQQQQEQQQDQQQQDQQQEPQEQPQPEQQQSQDWMEQMMNAAEQHEKQVRRRLDEQQQNQQRQRRSNQKNW